MKKIAVLMGGKSSEREVSLVSGRNVAEALASLGKYEVVPVDLKEENLDALPDGVDAVYIALHGGWGENGGVQAALNARAIPYTGPGVRASQVAMDKVRTKTVLERASVPTAPWALAGREDEASPLPLPVVVKPPRDGSSVGISKVTDAAGWRKALDAAFACASMQGPDDTALVEAFVPGREFTVAVVDGKAWPVIEIVAKGGWYGYAEKYDSDETRYPFLEDAGLAAELQALAEGLAFAMENQLARPANFYGVGGMKIFRDLIYVMQGMMKADHKFYKAQGLYDFPQKKKKQVLQMKLVGGLLSLPGAQKTMLGQMNRFIIAPYQKVLEGVRGEKP